MISVITSYYGGSSSLVNNNMEKLVIKYV